MTHHPDIIDLGVLARERDLHRGWCLHGAGKPVTACRTATEREGWADRERRFPRAGRQVAHKVDAGQRGG